MRISKSLPLLGLISVAACSSLNPVTAYRASQISPLTAEPSDFAVFVEMPPNLNIPAGKAVLSIGAENKALGVSDYRHYALEQVDVGARIRFRIPPKRLDELRAQQATIVKWESDTPRESSGSIGFNLEFCKTGDGPNLDDTFSAYLQLAPTEPPSPLFRNVRVRRAIKATGFEEDAINQIPDCDDIQGP